MKAPYILLALVLFLTTFSLGSVVLGKGNGNKKKPSSSPFDKKLKNKREELRKTKCNYLADDLMTSCQNYYISPTCFQRAYGEIGLEWGESSTHAKDTDFNDCYKRQMKEEDAKNK
jgi:hypothetical protein